MSIPKKGTGDVPRSQVPPLDRVSREEMARYYYDHAYVWANRGNLYGFPMHTETAEPTILENESSVAALAPVSTGAVVGLTCGRRAHLFYFHFAYGVVDLGLLSETPVAGGALVRTHGDTVLAGWHAGGSGGLARHDAAREMGTGQEDFRPPVGAVHRMATPGAEGVLALAYDRKRGVAYGLTCANRIISLSDGAARLRTELRTELTPAPVLAVLPDGRLLGAGQEGRLWEREPGAKRLHVLDAWAPCQKGKRYVAGVQSLLVASSGRVYGGTSTDGYLFSYNPVSGRLVNLGKPDRQSVIRCLAEGRDGTLYGIVQEPGGMAHLFSFDPEAREFEDRGVIGSSFPVQWNAWSIGAMGVGEQGELYLGEDDSIGHLFVYHPPVPARKVQK